MDERTEELANANKRLVRLSEANSRFVPDEFLDHLGKEGIEDVMLGDHVERHMTLVFKDIRGFAKISEALNPEENFAFINTYLAGVVPIIQKNGGFIDKFIGDSVMALFHDDAGLAIRTAFEFEDFLETFNTAQLKKGKHKVRVGTGIHTGHLILGTIGHSNRLETTVVSDAVNTASRIEGLSKYYDAKVIATEATLKEIKNGEEFNYRFLDKVKVKGKSTTIEVYEFLSPKDVEKLRTLRDYKKGIAMIRERKIDEASQIFKKLAKSQPQDKAVAIFAERCSNYLQYKTEKWNEITQMMTK
ncbi:MAG: adenylate/guanylate cyclase domain-containing protein [Bacteroidota bacterium]